MFTEKEIAYIRSQPLGRIATVDQDGQPDNVAIFVSATGNGTINRVTLQTSRAHRDVVLHACHHNNGTD